VIIDRTPVLLKRCFMLFRNALWGLHSSRAYTYQYIESV